jgi:hypothetical protein
MPFIFIGQSARALVTTYLRIQVSSINDMCLLVCVSRNVERKRIKHANSIIWTSTRNMSRRTTTREETQSLLTDEQMTLAARMKMSFCRWVSTDLTSSPSQSN